MGCPWNSPLVVTIRICSETIQERRICPRYRYRRGIQLRRPDIQRTSFGRSPFQTNRDGQSSSSSRYGWENNRKENERGTSSRIYSTIWLNRGRNIRYGTRTETTIGRELRKSTHWSTRIIHLHSKTSSRPSSINE